MKRWLFTIPLFIAGLILGLYISRPTAARAQAQAEAKTTVQTTLVTTISGFGHIKQPATVVSGKILGFSCTSGQCFVLTEK